MKHIHTTATTIGKIKRKAKEIQATDNIALSEAREIASKEMGYDNYHHATKCLAASQQDAIKEAIKTVYLCILLICPACLFLLTTWIGYMKSPSD